MLGVPGDIAIHFVSKGINEWIQEEYSADRKVLNIELNKIQEGSGWSFLLKLFSITFLVIGTVLFGEAQNHLIDHFESREIGNIILFGSEVIPYFIAILGGIGILPYSSNYAWRKRYKTEIENILQEKNINADLSINRIYLRISKVSFILAFLLVLMVTARYEKYSHDTISERDYFSFRSNVYNYSDVKEIFLIKDTRREWAKDSLYGSEIKIRFIDGSIFRSDGDRHSSEKALILQTLEQYSGKKAKLITYRSPTLDELLQRERK
ncbi:MAG: hypothetical protein ACKVOR_12575 [Flavobacteriales bacterium]